MNGNIIILDGSPSVGKSTIARQIQEMADEPFYYFPIDDFMKKLPSRWIQFTDNLSLVEGIGYQMDTDPNGKPLIRFKAGPIGEKLIKGYILAIKGFSESGNHVIADAIITDQVWLEWMEEAFHALPTLFVGLHAPLEVLEVRERKRFEPTGTTRGRYAEVYGIEKPYDLTIDTSKINAEKAAQMILKQLNPDRS